MNDASPREIAWWPATVRTTRLTLRPVVAHDLDTAERLWRDELVRRHLGGPLGDEEIGTRLGRLPGAPGVFAVVDRAADAPVGLIIVDPGSSHGATEVSYALLPEHWGHGVGREAVAAAVDWSLRRVPGTDQVVAVTQSANTASRRLLEAIGMRCTEEIVEYGEPQAVYRTPTTGSPSHPASGDDQS